jgi:serine/threonine protein phosphatase 1
MMKSVDVLWKTIGMNHLAACDQTMLIQHFKRNARGGKDLVCGDVHGSFDALQAHLDVIGFEPESDRLFITGDLVDRGAGSHLARDWLAKPWVFSVRGNHEQMCIDVFEGVMEPEVHASNGGEWFLGLSRAEQAGYVMLFQNLPVAIELETTAGKVGIVHAECPVADWEDLHKAFGSEDRLAYIAACMWSRHRHEHRIQTLVDNVRAVVVGHSALGRRETLGNHIYIDTGAVFDGFFTILDAETLRPARMKAFASGSPWTL